MMNPVYIISACAISPQNSFESEDFLLEIRSTDTGKLFVQEPDYRPFINPVAIRRMSRLIKMGIGCGMKALQDAGVQTPDAIITGTGLGSMTDTEKFLKDMILLKEEALNPTFFIQSTYNSVNGWISVQTKSTGYSQTYVNRGFSMEMALMDARLFLNEAATPQYVLAGGFDELTEEYHLVKSKVGYWKEELQQSRELLQHNDTAGTIGGEGAAFFVLSNREDNALCQLRGSGMLQNPTAGKVASAILQLLQTYDVDAKAIDLVICGNDGDVRFEHLYTEWGTLLKDDTPFVTFKHLTGEYPTASGFAIWLATRLFSSPKTREQFLHQKGEDTTPRHILIVNHYLLNTVSVTLLSKK
ncbi:MAG TPA: beta-ketoacyl synthase chain length factor [Flavipsychrobacter sp.]|nr:beta-ketoacyl synthase chain length factor [Flavipsychrobacter sp.]